MNLFPTEKKTYSPALIGLLPIFYIGWSDSILSPSEIKLIHSRINKMRFLNKEEREYLIKWTDPENPPGPDIFKEWVRAIKMHSTHISSAERKSIADLCYQMAISMVEKEEDLVDRPLVRKAITDMEKALGLDNQASLRLLLDRLMIPLPVDESIPSFEIGSLTKVLDGDYHSTKERMRKLLQDPVFNIEELPRSKEEYRTLVLGWTKELSNQGLGAYSFPKKYGGKQRIGEHMVVFEMLAYRNLSLTVKFGVQFGLFGGAVKGLGTEHHYRLYLELIGKGQLLGCFAMTETGHGSNVKGLETTANYDHKTGLIDVHSPHKNAGKEYIGNALHASMAVVFAQLIVDEENHGVHAVMVPIRDPQGRLLNGIKIEDNGYKMGLNGVDNGKIWFDHVKVPRENVLNRYGGIESDGRYSSDIDNPKKRFFVMLGALVTGRISVGKAAVNVSKSALSIAIRYAIKRRQFDSKVPGKEMVIMDYPTHQRRLIPLLSKTYAYDISLTRLSKDHESAKGIDHREVETQAAGLKAIASWHNTFTVQECREACGGKGYLLENSLPDLKADSDIFTTFEGDNTVLLQLVAKGLLTQFRQSFHDEGFWAVARYIRKRVANTIAEFNPYYSRLTTSEHLLDLDFYMHAFRYHENKLMISVSSRMQDYLKKRIHPHDAFLKCQVHMIDLAKAYVERLVLIDFIHFNKNLEEPLRPVMNKLLCLYALATIEENKGWYLETGYLEGAKTKAIRRMVTKLCQELRYEAVALTKAWAIPDSLLNAEILENDYLS